VIDLRPARADPEAFRAAVARKGAGEAFDRLLEADARWRELVPQVDELRGRQKIQGKPTPEQVEELKRVQ
jgi:seryl-tRNA synthetase